MTDGGYHPHGGRDRRIVLLFWDGVGLAPESPANPLSKLPMPVLRRALGGALTTERVGAGAGFSLAALDANLGVPGLPQSATGQTTLFTGINAAAAIGRHVSAFPGPRLRALIREHGLLGRARSAGLAATFANAYSPAYLEAVAAGRARASVTTRMVEAAGGRFRGPDDLTAGRAVTFDVTRERWSERSGVDSPRITPREAGHHLAALAADHDLVVWETFLTDLAGHGRRGVTPADALSPLDGLLGGLLEAAPAGTTVLVTSDHGNLEEPEHGRHTRNPVPLLALGAGAADFAALDSLCAVTPGILAFLEAEPS